MTPPAERHARRRTGEATRRAGPCRRGTVSIPEGTTLVVAVDTLVAGVHFPLDTRPEDVGHKALAVNLSDLAAMGATPAACSVALSLPGPGREEETGVRPNASSAGIGEPPAPDWAGAFLEGLADLAHRHDVALAALHRVEAPLRVTVEVYGHVPAGAATLRRGARPGDGVYVSGTVGDAGLALEALVRGRLLAPGTLDTVRARLDRPEPRVTLGLALRGLASAAIDVSDGLAADLGHVLGASGVGAEIEATRLPLSAAVREAVDLPTGWRLALAGGDDYELAFTVPPQREDEVELASRATGVQVTRIGRVVDRPGLACLTPDHSPFPIPRGYEHFTPTRASTSDEE